MSIQHQIKKAPGVPETGRLGLKQILTRGGTQSRERISPSVVAEYAEAISGGASFPPVVTFYDGRRYWLADGFHRVEAHQRLGKKTIAVDVRQGSNRDAILFSLGANGAHGLRRTNDDKRRAVLTLLRDEEWATKSERWIASTAAVSHTYVQKVRAEYLATLPDKPVEREVTRNGQAYTMDVSAIGQSDPEVDPEEEFQAGFEETADDQSTSRPEAFEDEEEPVPALAEPPAPTAPRDPLKAAYDAFIARIDAIGSVAPDDIIKACPIRSRAALCTRLAPLVGAFNTIMEAFEP